MNLTYTYCKKVIQNGTYGDKEDMLQKLDVFLLNNRITQDEYNELVGLVNLPVSTDTSTSDSSNATENTTQNVTQ